LLSWIGRTIIYETEYDSCQGTALAESDENAVEISLPAHLRTVAKRSAAIFLWKRLANGSAKNGMTETSRRANGKIQE